MSPSTLKEMELRGYVTEAELYSSKDYSPMQEAIDKLAKEIIEALF